MNTTPKALGKIQHVFVLMLENRSFDHMFGASGLTTHPLLGTETCSIDPARPWLRPPMPVTQNAPNKTHPDPPHELMDVCYQMTGRDDGNYAGAPISMDGFAASARVGLLQGESAGNKAKLAAARDNGAYALRCHDGTLVKWLRALGEEFAVCEQWYSSMPGPTWPNRFFVHAGSSGGLDNSPSAIRAGLAVIIDALGFDFENKTIYERLGKGNWRIYHDGALAQALAIKGLVTAWIPGKDRGFWRFRPFFERHLASCKNNPAACAQFPRYVFIEPNHDILHGGKHGNSQHPEGLVSAGEELIRDVYRAIRLSDLWKDSVLVITYDEHGGFYDREPPPEVRPPGDKALNHKKAEFPGSFRFDRLGPRVPTVIVSPWIRPGIIDSTIYDHTSILSTLRELFEFEGFDGLTARDKNANSFGHLLNLDDWRRDCLEDLPGDASPAEKGEPASETNDNNGDPVDPSELSAGGLAGFLRIAMCADYLLSREDASWGRRLLHSTAGRIWPDIAIKTTPSVKTRGDAMKYIAMVSARLESR